MKSKSWENKVDRMLLRGGVTQLNKKHTILGITESIIDVTCAHEDEKRMFTVPCKEQNPHQSRKAITYFTSRYQGDGGPTRNQAPVLNILIVLFSVLLTVTTAVEIHVETPVIVLLPAREAVLPCSISYRGDERNHSVTIMWEEDHRDGPSVIWRQSDGTDAPALKYKNTVKFGDGCSLVIKNPNSGHSGVYTVTVDVLSEVSESVTVFVFNSTFKKHSTSEPNLSTSTTTDTSRKVNRTDGWIISTLVLVAVLFGFVLVVLIPDLHRKRKRSQNTELREIQVNRCSQSTMLDRDDDTPATLQRSKDVIVNTIKSWRPKEAGYEKKSIPYSQPMLSEQKFLKPAVTQHLGLDVECPSTVKAITDTSETGGSNWGSDQARHENTAMMQAKVPEVSGHTSDKSR